MIVKLDLVVWRDSGIHFAHAWTALDVATRRVDNLDDTVNTVGYVVYENDEYVVLAQSLDNENSNLAGAWAILKSCIVTRITLDEKEWRHNGDS